MKYIYLLLFFMVNSLTFARSCLVDFSIQNVENGGEEVGFSITSDVANLSRATVKVDTWKTDGRESYGTGTIIHFANDPDTKYLLTAAHVIADGYQPPNLSYKGKSPAELPGIKHIWIIPDYRAYEHPWSDPEPDVSVADKYIIAGNWNLDDDAILVNYGFKYIPEGQIGYGSAHTDWALLKLPSLVSHLYSYPMSNLFCSGLSIGEEAYSVHHTEGYLQQVNKSHRVWQGEKRPVIITIVDTSQKDGFTGGGASGSAKINENSGDIVSLHTGSGAYNDYGSPVFDGICSDSIDYMTSRGPDLRNSILPYVVPILRRDGMTGPMRGHSCSSSQDSWLINAFNNHALDLHINETEDDEGNTIYVPGHVQTWSWRDKDSEKTGDIENQQWTIDYGVGEIKTSYAFNGFKLCLEALGSLNNNAISVSSCDNVGTGHPRQQWEFNSDGSIESVYMNNHEANTNSNRYCLTRSDEILPNGGGKLRVIQCTGDSRQRWLWGSMSAVNGRVTDSNNNPVIDASITVLYNSIDTGTAVIRQQSLNTNENGEYLVFINDVPEGSEESYVVEASNNDFTGKSAPLNSSTFDDDTRNIQIITAPTNVVLTTWEAKGLGNNGIQINWQTSDEYDYAGAVLHRSTRKDFRTSTVVSEVIVGTCNSGHTGDYQWIDTNAIPSQIYYYWLESVSCQGNESKYYGILGPVSTESDEPVIWQESHSKESTIVGIIKNNNTQEPLPNVTITGTCAGEVVETKTSLDGSYSLSWSGNWNGTTRCSLKPRHKYYQNKDVNKLLLSGKTRVRNIKLDPKWSWLHVKVGKGGGFTAAPEPEKQNCTQLNNNKQLCKLKYSRGTEIILTPNPNTNQDYELLKWKECDSIVDNTCKITLNRNKKIWLWFKHTVISEIFGTVAVGREVGLPEDSIATISCYGNGAANLPTREYTLRGSDPTFKTFYVHWNKHWDGDSTCMVTIQADGYNNASDTIYNFVKGDSKYRHFNLELKLSQPSLLSPVNNTNFNSTNVEYNWDDVVGAQTYQLAQRYLGYSWGTHVNITNSQITKVRNPGVTQWRVRACKNNSCSNWSSVRSYTITQ